MKKSKREEKPNIEEAIVRKIIKMKARNSENEKFYRSEINKLKEVCETLVREINIERENNKYAKKIILAILDYFNLDIGYYTIQDPDWIAPEPIQPPTKEIMRVIKKEENNR